MATPQITRLIKDTLKRVPPIKAATEAYWVAQAHRTVHGHYPPLLRPRTFSEKVCHRLMFDRRPLLTQLADKYSARAYIEKRLGSSVLPRMYHVTRDPATIPWSSLPDRYVVKATHGSGWVRIVTRAPDREALTRLCTEWLGLNYYRMRREWPYKKITPRILIEEFIDDGTEGVPLDFKFFAFDGRPAIIQVDASPFSGHTRSFYDLDWKPLPIALTYPNIPNEVARPVHLPEMIEAAATLSRGIDFIRVDLYDTPDQFYAGELTTAPGAGLEEFAPAEFDAALGDLWLAPGRSRAKHTESWKTPAFP